MAESAKGNGTPSDKLFEAAMSLPPEARAALASALIESLDEEVDEDAEAAWAQEIEKRIRDMDEGRVRSIPWSQARRIILGS